jgi:hypothetical protein
LFQQIPLAKIKEGELHGGLFDGQFAILVLANQGAADTTPAHFLLLDLRPDSR